MLCDMKSCRFKRPVQILPWYDICREVLTGVSAQEQWKLTLSSVHTDLLTITLAMQKWVENFAKDFGRIAILSDAC